MNPSRSGDEAPENAAPLIPNPTIGQRIDLLAASNHRFNNRNIWFFGVLGAWTGIGLVASAIRGDWGTATILLGTAVLSGLMLWVSVRARRRIPDTERSLTELRRGAESGPAERA
jgi:hypothetical protein